MTCRKVAYRSRLSAQIALANTHHSQSSSREEQRIYYCADCRAYHLTSKK